MKLELESKSKRQTLIFLRHAIALDKAIAREQNMADAHRALTSYGYKKFKKYAIKNKKYFKKASLFVTSPYVRAVQTLDVIFSVLNKQTAEVTVYKYLTPNDDPKHFLNWLKTRNEKHIVVVSHEDFMSRLMRLKFGKAWKSGKIKKGHFVVIKTNAQGVKFKMY